MKKFLSRFLALGTALALTASLLPATLAAESAISVQLDGQDLTFTDAVPQVRDQRTFLPFRAVFEAMGAQVSNEGSVITAVRGDKTLTMTLNETTATVTEGGKSTAIAMDVAPYVDNATWRTYVPVRFAAEAFGCVVGWDQAASTAIIVDTDKVVDAALEGKSFTNLEKLMAYSEKYNAGIWDMEAVFEATVGLMGMAMTMNGAMTGTVEDSAKMDADMNMKMDMSGLLNGIALLSGQAADLSPEDQAMLDSMKNEGVDLSMRGDLATGKLYMSMSGDLFTAAGLESGTWYEMDLAALMTQLGMDWSELMEMSKSVDYVALAKQVIAAMEPTDAASAYDTVKSTVEQVVTALSDEGFVKETLPEGDEYTTVLDFSEDDVAATLALVLGMKNDAVVAYSMGISMASEDANAPMTVEMVVSMDEDDQMSADLFMDVAGLIDLTMTMEGGYKQGTAAPVVTPPEGATVVDYLELLGGGNGMGMIGGADGPTAIIVGQ